LQKEFLGLISRLPQRSGFFHPDLINVCDVAPGKASRHLTEACHAGEPFKYKKKEAPTI
jgi:hypothetical protein